MTRTKRERPKYDYQPYPEPVEKRIGIKVSWYYFTEREQAETCAKAARHNAGIQASLGYDFGYNSPGYIRQLTKDTDYGEGRILKATLFEVCIP
jgi:hypothetical protein